MTHTFKNYSFQQPVASNGDTFRNCNLFQLLPHTPICAGITGLTFDDCNLINCKLPADAIFLSSSNRAQIDYCAWLHPEMGLVAEVENCRHVTATDTISIDGQVVDTVYTRQDKDA